MPKLKGNSFTTPAKKKKVITHAIACSDIHFSSNAPVARSLEDCWYKCQQDVMFEVFDICRRCKAPLIIAGDVFDKPDASSKLINFVINLFKRYGGDVYAVYGQHDLPYHDANELGASALWTLAAACPNVTIVEPNAAYQLPGDAVLQGYGWGHKISPYAESITQTIISINHAYIWNVKSNAHVGAEIHTRVSAYRKALKGHDFAVFGDNHKPFAITHKLQEQHIINCGSLMRRSLDEFNLQPCVYQLKSDKTFEAIELDISSDKYIDAEPLLELLDEGAVQARDFLKALQDAGQSTVGFGTLVRRWLKHNDAGKAVEKLLRELVKGTE